MEVPRLHLGQGVEEGGRGNNGSTQDVTNKCFERDWSHSKIPNLVKNSEEQLKVKSLLHLHYKHIKDIYRFYSSWSPFDSIWAVSANAFTEFCNEAKIISK